MLGPLSNPAGARCQIIGVFAAVLTEPFANVLKLLGSKRAFVVHGHDGMDEITITAPTRISELVDGAIKTYEFTPLEFIGNYAELDSVAGGDPLTNAEITKQVLSGTKGAHRDIVCLNAAAALVAGGKTNTIRDGWQLAQNAIDNGKAMAALKKLVEISAAG